MRPGDRVWQFDPEYRLENGLPDPPWEVEIINRGCVGCYSVLHAEPHRGREAFGKYLMPSSQLYRTKSEAFHRYLASLEEHRLDLMSQTEETRIAIASSTSIIANMKNKQA